MKVALTGEIFEQPLGGMSWIQGKLADHVGDHVVPSSEGAVLVASPGTESSYPRPPRSLNNSKRPSDSVCPIHRHHPYVVRGNCDLPSTRTCSIPPFAMSQEAPSCSLSPPPFARQEFPPFCDLFFPFPFPCPRSRLLFWSRDVGSAVPPPPPIFRLRSESGAYASFGVMTVVGTNGLACGFN